MAEDEKLKAQCAERKAQREEMKRRKRGRPKKKEIEAKKAGNRGKVGRPAGDASIINEYKARMLASPKSEAVLQSIFDAALNDDHKNQAAAWKLVMDRVAPVSYFEKDKLSGGKSAIQINITGVGDATVSGSSSEEQGEEAAIDGEFEPIDAHGDDHGDD